MATVATRRRRKNHPDAEQKQIYLTPTGPLMEGHSARNPPEPTILSAMGMLHPAHGNALIYRTFKRSGGLGSHFVTKIAFPPEWCQTVPTITAPVGLRESPRSERNLIMLGKLLHVQTLPPPILPPLPISHSASFCL